MVMFLQFRLSAETTLKQKVLHFVLELQQFLYFKIRIRCIKIQRIKTHLYVILINTNKPKFFKFLLHFGLKEIVPFVRENYIINYTFK